jgi:hypothetical protein
VNDPDLGDLPSLRQWGEELREATGRAEQQHRRSHLRLRRFPVRRLGVAIVAMFVLVPGAVATRSIWNDPVQRVSPLEPKGATPAVRLASGSTDGVTWRLGGYDAVAGNRCVEFTARGDVRPFRGRSCAPPFSRAQITVLATPTGRVGFIYGTVSTEVRRVEVVVPGGRRVSVTTTGISADVVRRSRMPGGFRVFVAPFPGGFPAGTQAQVTAYGSAGNTVGALGPR